MKFLSKLFSLFSKDGEQTGQTPAASPEKPVEPKTSTPDRIVLDMTGGKQPEKPVTPPVTNITPAVPITQPVASTPEPKISPLPSQPVQQEPKPQQPAEIKPTPSPTTGNVPANTQDKPAQTPEEDKPAIPMPKPVMPTQPEPGSEPFAPETQAPHVDLPSATQPTLPSTTGNAPAGKPSIQPQHQEPGLPQADKHEDKPVKK